MLSTPQFTAWPGGVQAAHCAAGLTLLGSSIPHATLYPPNEATRPGAQQGDVQQTQTVFKMPSVQLGAADQQPPYKLLVMSEHQYQQFLLQQPHLQQQQPAPATTSAVGQDSGGASSCPTSTRTSNAGAGSAAVEKQPAGPCRSGLNSLLAAIDATQAEEAAEARVNSHHSKRPASSRGSAEECGNVSKRSRPASSTQNDASQSPASMPKLGSPTGTHSSSSSHEKQHACAEVFSARAPSRTAGSDDESNCSGQTAARSLAAAPGPAGANDVQHQPAAAQPVQPTAPQVAAPPQQYGGTMDQSAAVLGAITAKTTPGFAQATLPTAGVQPFMAPGQHMVLSQQLQHPLVLDVQGLQFLAQTHPQLGLPSMAPTPSPPPAWAPLAQQPSPWMLSPAQQHLASQLQTPQPVSLPGAMSLPPHVAMGYVQPAASSLLMSGQAMPTFAASQPYMAPSIMPSMNTHLSMPHTAPAWKSPSHAELDAALQEIVQVMLHKPRGRPVKYIDLGVNRMALKYHVGVKLNGRVESVGATDTELAAQMLLDMAKIGLGLYTSAAAGAAPSAEAHPDEQMTAQLTHPPSIYSTALVQRVVAQLINRSMVSTSELSHAYTRAHAAGCAPAQCFTSVAAALFNNAPAPM